jgi:long-chain acyl-CoA synthetase
MKFLSVVEAVAYYGERVPDKVCLIDADTHHQMTYGDLWRLSRIFARRLLREGLQNGDRVIVRVGSLIETFIAQFGIYLAGGVYCPVEKRMKEQKILEMLDYFDSSFLISSERIDSKVKWIDILNPCCDTEPLHEYTFPSLEQLCAIIFTTGTTGKAKGVMLSMKSITEYINARYLAYGVDNEEVLLSVQPLDRVNGVKKCCAPLLNGGTLVHFTGVIFMADLFAAIKQYKVSTLSLQATVLSIMLNMARHMFADISVQIRIVSISGSLLSETHHRALRELLPDTKIFVYYGATEISPISCYEVKDEYKPNCVGKPSQITRVLFVDEHGDAMENTSKSNCGIIACESATMMLGYWNAPELTAETIIDGRIILTDMGYMDSDGFLYLVGRRDDVIVSGGQKIAPYEIEEIVTQMPEVSECACVPHKDAVLGYVPRLFVAVKNGEEFSAKKISNYLSARIENFKMPRTILEIEKMPRVHGTNKIDRMKLNEC